MAQKFTLPDLPYAYDALEPVISSEIMELHHKKHHNGYVNNLNAALEKYEEAEKGGDLTAMISLQQAIRFNGGGHLNHTLFWENLCPPGQSGAPTGKLAECIDKRWGSVETFIEKFNAKVGPLQGSGWGWLCFCHVTGQLEIETCSNQDPLAGIANAVPLLGVDVWEHAYYLQYKNARPEYLKAIWQVVNWACVSERFERACAACPACK